MILTRPFLVIHMIRYTMYIFSIFDVLEDNKNIKFLIFMMVKIFLSAFSLKVMTVDAGTCSQNTRTIH